MATRKRELSPAVDEDGNPLSPATWQMPTAPEEDETSEEENAIDRVLSLLSGSATSERVKVKLYRRVPNAPDQWCADYSPHDFETGGLQMIRDTWGAGSFQIRVYGPRPDGRSGILMRDQIDIAATPNGAVLSTNAAAPSTGIERAIEAMVQGQNAILQALTTRPDPLQQIKEMGALMGVMREAMGIGGANSGATAQAPSLLTQLKELRELQTFAQELKGGEEPKSELDKMLTAAAPLVETIVTAVKGRSQPETPLPAIMAPASIANAPAPIQNDTQPKGPLNVEEIKQALESLLLLAKENADIEQSAEFVADRIPDDLIDMLASPLWWILLKGYDERVKPFEEWFTKVRARAIELLEEDDNGEDSPPAPGASLPGA